MVLVLHFQQLRLSQLQTAAEVVLVTGCFLVRPTEIAYRVSMNHVLPFLRVHFLYLTGWGPLNTFPELGDCEVLSSLRLTDRLNESEVFLFCFVFLTRKTEKFEPCLHWRW